MNVRFRGKKRHEGVRFNVFLCYEGVGGWVWRRSGSAIECRTLDRENPVMNPLHIKAPLMATHCGGVTPQQNKILVCTWMIFGNKLWFTDLLLKFASKNPYETLECPPPLTRTFRRSSSRRRSGVAIPSGRSRCWGRRRAVWRCWCPGTTSGGRSVDSRWTTGRGSPARTPSPQTRPAGESVSRSLGELIHYGIYCSWLHESNW